MRKQVKIAQCDRGEDDFVSIQHLNCCGDGTVEELDETFTCRDSNCGEGGDENDEPNETPQNTFLEDVAESVQRELLEEPDDN